MRTDSICCTLNIVNVMHKCDCCQMGRRIISVQEWTNGSAQQSGTKTTAKPGGRVGIQLLQYNLVNMHGTSED